MDVRSGSGCSEPSQPTSSAGAVQQVPWLSEYRGDRMVAARILSDSAMKLVKAQRSQMQSGSNRSMASQLLTTGKAVASHLAIMSGGSEIQHSIQKICGGPLQVKGGRSEGG